MARGVGKSYAWLSFMMPPRMDAVKKPSTSPGIQISLNALFANNEDPCTGLQDLLIIKASSGKYIATIGNSRNSLVITGIQISMSSY